MSERNDDLDQLRRERDMVRAQLTAAHQRIAGLVEQQRRTERLLGAPQRFLAAAAHDLRAPLRAIEVLAGFIQEDLVDANEPVQENLTLLRQRARRMDQLLMRLLEYVRVGHEAIEIYQVDVATLLVDTIDLLSIPNGFAMDIGDELPLFETGRGPLERVFLNLIGNAIKHHDRPSGRVVIRCEEGSAEHRFSVADDGPGIPPSFQPRALEMFTTLHPPSDSEGHGMGLALVRRIVDDVGGTLQLESPIHPDGRGTRFAFTWPKKWRSVDHAKQPEYRSIMNGYANEGALASTDWVLAHKDDADVCVVEVDVDTEAYKDGHIHGAIAWNWQKQLCDRTMRDIISRDDLQKLLAASGISNTTHIVLYGDNNNWFAAWAYWQLRIFGHEKVSLMNGGRKKWMLEGKQMTDEAPERAVATYEARQPDFTTRAYLEHAKAASEDVAGAALVDVRSPDEYTGKLLCPPGLPETCQRGGHIPGARNVPWGMNCNEDGTFKTREELMKLYEPLGVTPDKDVVAYCRIGERSSLTWFVLKDLMGYPSVRNYDGSWTEWGNLVAAPIARGDAVR